MKRKEIVSKLIKEGFSEKTLALMSDKELTLMSSRVLDEQAPVQSITNVSKNDIATMNALKQQKKPFATYEGEMSEEDMGGDSKEYFIKKIKYKLEHETDEKKIGHLKDLLKRIGGEVSEPEMVGLNEWVDRLVGKNVHPFTSKTEILSLINKKLHEQEADVAEPEVETLPDWLTYDAIMAAGSPAPAEPTTKPITKPGNPDRKRKDDPYNPSPGIKTRPKAEKK